MVRGFRRRCRPQGSAHRAPVRGTPADPDYLISMRERIFARNPDRLCCGRRPEPEHGAGWSSLVARQAHNLKVVGSNPTPATTEPLENIDVFKGFSFSGRRIRRFGKLLANSLIRKRPV